MSELQGNVEISVPGIHVNIIKTNCKHKGEIKSCCKITRTLFFMLTEIKIDVLFVHCTDKSGRKYSDTSDDKHDRNAAPCNRLIRGLLIVAESDLLAEEIELFNDTFDGLLYFHDGR